MTAPHLPRRLRWALGVGCVIASAGATARANDLAAWRSDEKVGALQHEIDKLRPGDTLRLAAGVFEGPIIIRTPGLTLDGGGQAEIDGGGAGTVVVVAAADVTLRDLRITGSGQAHEQVDAGISVRSARNVRIEGVTVADCLFGIDMEYSRGVVVTRNRISSKNLALGLRGDAIRIHSSQDVLIAGNHWSHARDVVAWYSEGITFQSNLGEDSRYSLHSMYTKRLNIVANRFLRNSVGIFLMYGNGMTVRKNVIMHSLGATGVGIGLKETSGIFVQDNTILYCASGILVDNSPWEPTMRNWFYRNTVAFSTQGVLLSNDRAGNEFRGNVFQANLVDVQSESRGRSHSLWEGNVWDKYAGFDRDRNGVGDTAHVLHSYGDAMADTHSFTGFFHATPVELLIETIQRLVPLTEPTVVLQDPKPGLAPAKAAL